MSSIHIQNAGPEIISTNFFDSPWAARGWFYLSSNAGAFRLLVPDMRAAEIEEWRAAREVIISRGPWPEADKPDALEVLFVEDGSDSPYAIHLSPEQVDRLPLPSDQDEPGRPPRWRFSAWISDGKDSRPAKVFELPCRYRIVPELPCLRGWEE